ncbi:glycoside hydrolase family 5 protein [Neorhizobium sp. JUb45]|uniref:glycoside hydrolase family 5 protein n=1 Tax=unclassified Neorhizobium TaxID=2629175 RepID=UPI0010446AA3|nr:glycoside hydrolase family 5 protein [Neorhizobium sp. JUb45]
MRFLSLPLHYCLTICLVLLGGAANAQSPRTAEQQTAALARGVNFGGILEAPDAAERAKHVDRSLFTAVKEGGFSTIRLPVRFSNHAGLTAPYTLDEAFMRHVDNAVASALAEGLTIIIDFHHYRQMDGDPLDTGEARADLSDDGLRDRFKLIWQQIAERYRSQPVENVLFEIYNEPHGKTDGAVWNDLATETLSVIRKSNPDRFVIVDAGNWATAWGLETLKLPETDRNLIVSVHNYAPFEFTMQGASWIENSAGWVGTPCCSKAQIAKINEPLDIAVEWARKNNRPIFLGEFGANSIAGYEDRVRYARIMRDEAEKRGFSWAYWDFSSDEFGPWDYLAKKWRVELRDALTGK